MVTVALHFAFSTATPQSAKADSPILQAAKGTLRPAKLSNGHVLPFFSGGVIDAASNVLNSNANSNAIGIANDTLGCSDRNLSNSGDIRVNQDCTYRRQAEESIAVNPTNPKNLIAGQNDSRIGFNHCGFDYSLDGGHNWGDGLPPFWQHLNDPQAQLPSAADPNSNTILDGTGTMHTYDAASDPGVTFDSQGNAFFSCVVFDVFSNASALLVTASPAAAHGSFYNNVPELGHPYVVVEDNSPLVLHDKPFIRADNFASSPNRDNVYAVWTVFKYGTNCISASNPGGYCESPIYFSMSTDHAVTWSTPEEISGVSPLCVGGNTFNTTLSPNACNFDQGADPIVLPNGDVVVTFNNANTPSTVNQQLAVHCHPTGQSPNGTAHGNCAAPVKVGDDVTTGEPLCDFGRGPEECVPGPFIRTNDFPRIAVDRKSGSLYVVWQDYKSGHEYDIEISQSTDGGLTWTEANSPVNPSTGLDHYMPAVDVANSNSMNTNANANEPSNVAVSYYRSPQPTSGPPFTQATTGQEYFLAGGEGLETPYLEVRAAPMTPGPDGIQAGFNGDYSGLVVIGTIAYPIWSDTRNKVPASVNTITPQGVIHDEDIFTIALRVPNP